jgi:Na+-transporting methylmalonyl-CoA/oxaloacetate decarboxylase gamma subunit
MEQEKDNFWFYIAGVIIFAIVLVFAMRGQRSEMESSVKNPSVQAESKAEVEKEIARIHGQK